jgi:hypothetical protein
MTSPTLIVEISVVIGYVVIFYGLLEPYERYAKKGEQG